MKFIVGIVIGFVAANLEGICGAANKLADGFDALAEKLHAWADSKEGADE